MYFRSSLPELLFPAKSKISFFTVQAFNWRSSWLWRVPPPLPHHNVPARYPFFSLIVSEGFLFLWLALIQGAPSAWLGAKARVQSAKGRPPIAMVTSQAEEPRGPSRVTPWNNIERSVRGTQEGVGGGIFHNRSKKFAHPCWNVLVQNETKINHLKPSPAAYVTYNLCNLIDDQEGK